MKLVLFISYNFSKKRKKRKLTCISLCHKNLKKYLFMKVTVKKFSLNTSADN